MIPYDEEGKNEVLNTVCDVVSATRLKRYGSVAEIDADFLDLSSRNTFKEYKLTRAIFDHGPKVARFLGVKINTK